MKSPGSDTLQTDLERAKGEIVDLREELRKAVEAAEQTRIEMRQKLQDLAQDFRGPVTSVLGFSEVVIATNKSPRPEWKEINAAGRQLLNLIMNLESSSVPAKPLQDRETTDGTITRGNDATQFVLHIEGNKANFRLIQLFLQDRPGTRMHWASTGEKGLEFACNSAPALILLDLNLPDVDGSDVLARLQMNPLTAKIPVIIISEDATPSQIERMLQAGARDYLTKPLEAKRLLCLVDEILERSVLRHA